MLIESHLRTTYANRTTQKQYLNLPFLSKYNHREIRKFFFSKKQLKSIKLHEIIWVEISLISGSASKFLMATLWLRQGLCYVLELLSILP